MATLRTAMGDDTATTQQDGPQAAPDIWLPIDPNGPPDDDGMMLSQPVTSDAIPAFDAAPSGTVGSLLPHSTALQEVSFLTGLNADGTLTTNSFWGANASIAHKWGSSGAGTAGGTLTYVFDPASNFTATEKATFQHAFSMWSAVANVQFAETASSTGASVLLHRGSDRSAYETDGGHLTSNGSRLATHTGQSMISIDTSVNGFDLSGSFDKVGGYGFQTAVHEIGHLLGLGHGGDYNGNVNPATEQYSPYDERSWTLMSYIYWQQSNAKFAGNYEVKGVNWGSTSDGYYLQSSTTWMPLDILAIQRIYGAPSSSALPGGQVFGFNTNITGDLKNSFDFTINTHPVVTLYDTGTGNTLDLSGFSRPSTILLSPGSFSSANGEVSDIAIAYGTQIDAAIGGSGNDTIVGNAGDNLLTGGLGNDNIDGGDGIDTARFSGQASAYTLSKAGAVYTIVGPDGTDTLTNVENLQFGGAAPIAIDSLLPSASFNFSFATAKVVFNGSAVSITGSDGTTTTVTGIHVYNFTDGTINEDQGSPLVDDLYYLANNKDVWAAKLDPETHYDTYGYMENRDPNAFFSTKGYLGANPDVKAAGLNPLLHYDAMGWHEGRDPSGSFDTGLYLLHNPDVNAAGVDPLLHFIKSGQAEGRAASAAIGAPVTHGSFDAEYYLLKNPDVAASMPSGANAAEFAFKHYDLLGWHELRDPNAFFSTSGYLNAYKDVAAADMDPLTHYDGSGWKEGRDPSTSFDTKQYLGAYMDVRNAGMDPLTHYLADGANEGRSTFSDGKFG